MGAIADVLWHEIKNHAKNVKLGQFVVMPNHIHGILILDKPNVPTHPTHPNVGARHALPLRLDGLDDSDDSDSKKTIGQKRFQNQGKNTVSSIIGSYKSAVTRHIRRLGYEFAWQPRFWDHIVRDKEAYHRISQYIVNNPKKWEADRLNGGEGNVVL